MNAQELTEKYFKDHQQIYEMQKNIDYLLQENEKLRRMVEDLQIDVKMLQTSRRS